MNKSDILTNFTKSFSSISLGELNEKAEMLDRSENKYIFSDTQLNTVLQSLTDEFDILEINGKRVFTYETIYFDDNQICYLQHHQGKRQRFKVRTRRYIDSDLYFFEVKLKDLRGKTVKMRYKCEASDHGVLTAKAANFAQESFNKIYKKDFSYTLTPASKMSYNRITLVAKAGSERMTIDYALSFNDFTNNDSVLVPESFIIIETKSLSGNGIADKIFKKYKHRSISCSKFCLSRIMLGQVTKFNKFRPLLKRHLPFVLLNG